jgi:FAD/FMN-containing dehydrogenase
MVSLDSFVNAVKSSFPDDRSTRQKSVATFHPDSADEAAQLFKLANQYRQPLFITGFGNNIDPVGEPFERMLSVRTDRLNDLIDVRAEDFYVVVGAGYPLKELNIDLEPSGLFCPLADLPYVGSIGGAVAINLSGQLGGHSLPMKRYLIKAEIVTPVGEIVRPGSVCFKSVSGYDVVKLFAPSWGLLGLVISATLRVLPLSARPEYAELKMNGIDRQRFLRGLDENSSDADAVYSRKIKEKFDPNGILPIV